ncbi:MAG: metallopeptidase family protein [Gammaproteobacteria bacterium]
MNLSQFETVIRETMNGLPEWVRDALDNIEILVLDEADEDLDPDGEGLLGLYMGMPLPERGVEYAGELPDVIYIFRQPHLELGLPPRELEEEIARTLIHEVAHYFGIDDDHLDEIGWG